MAQRMESVAPPDGVMLSASTARLVEGAVVLGGAGDGADQGRKPMRCLHTALDRPPPAIMALVAQRLPTPVGRTWRLDVLPLILDEAERARGCVNRRPWAARHRQEPYRPRGRDHRGRPRGKGVRRLLRVPYRRYSLSCGDVASGRAASGVDGLDGRGRAGPAWQSRFAEIGPGGSPAAEMICWSSPIPTPQVPDHRGRRPAAAPPPRSSTPPSLAQDRPSAGT